MNYKMSPRKPSQIRPYFPRKIGAPKTSTRASQAMKNLAVMQALGPRASISTLFVLVAPTGSPLRSLFQTSRSDTRLPSNASLPNRPREREPVRIASQAHPHRPPTSRPSRRNHHPPSPHLTKSTFAAGPAWPWAHSIPQLYPRRGRNVHNYEPGGSDSRGRARFASHAQAACRRS